MAKLSAAEVVDTMLEEFSAPPPAGSSDDPWRAKGGLKKLHFKMGDFQGKRPGESAKNVLRKIKIPPNVNPKHAGRFQWKPEEHK